MKCVCVTFILLALVTGGQATAGDAGAVCTSSDACTDSNAYCDTTDTNNKLCKCNTGWVQKSTACARGHSQPCGASQCLSNGVCTSGACSCNTTMGFAAGSSGDNSCSCPSGYTVRASDGHCAKTIGQSCSANTDCIDNAVCDSSSSQCTCNTANNFAAGTSGDITCSCDTSKATLDSSTGTCQLKHTQSCTANSQCVSTAGMVCTGGACTCDTSNNFAAGSAGDITCSCDTNYAIKSDNTCGKKESQPCTSSDTCVDHATCSTTCNCDASGNWEASSSNLCQCAASTHALKSDGTCGKKIGETCSAGSECIDNAACVTTSCTCDASLNRDASTASGATSCPCDANSVESNDVCYKKVGQTCSAASECISTPGMICADVSGTMKCTCNTTAYYAAGGNGDTTCSCTSANYNKETDGSCALKVSQTCSTTSGAPCVTGAMCDKKTLTCLCDTANNFKTSGTACICADNAVTISGTSMCGLKVGGTCATDGCTTGASCSITSAGTSYQCQCPGGVTAEQACSGAASVLASIAVMAAGLFATCRLL